MKLIKKTEIGFKCTSHACTVVGPAKVCNQLLEMGAYISTTRTTKGVTKAWKLPPEKAEEVRQWYDSLPDEIYQYDRVDKARMTKAESESMKVGAIYTINVERKKKRAFQIVSMDDTGNAVVREVKLINGEPKADDWVYIEHQISPLNKFIDGRPLKVYKP